MLAYFRAYSGWNPLNVSADGDARLDARVAMRFVDCGGKGKIVEQTVTITALEPEHILEKPKVARVRLAGIAGTGSTPLPIVKGLS